MRKKIIDKILRNISTELQTHFWQKIFCQTSIIILFLLNTNASFSQNLCKQNFRGDNTLTGNSTVKISIDLKQIWNIKLGEKSKSSPVICNKTIYIGSSDGNVYALDFTGKTKWKFNTGNSIESSPAIVENLIIVGNLSGDVFAIDATTGKQVWKYKTDGQINGSVNWININNKTQILIPSYDYFLHCVNLKDGKLLWKFETENYLNGTPATDNKNIIIGGCDAYIHIVNASSGKESKKIKMDTYIPESSAISGNFAFAGDYSGNFFSLDILNKKIAWKYTSSEEQPFLCSPAVSDKVAIVGSHDKKVYCFDKKSGKINWTFITKGKIESSPIIAADRVLVCSKDGFMRILSVTTGKEIWKYDLGIGITNTPAVSNNMIVVGTDDGRLFGFGKK